MNILCKGCEATCSSREILRSILVNLSEDLFTDSDLDFNPNAMLSGRGMSECKQEGGGGGGGGDMRTLPYFLLILLVFLVLYLFQHGFNL